MNYKKGFDKVCSDGNPVRKNNGHTRLGNCRKIISQSNSKHQNRHLFRRRIDKEFSLQFNLYSVITKAALNSKTVGAPHNDIPCAFMTGIKLPRDCMHYDMKINFAKI